MLLRQANTNGVITVIILLVMIFISWYALIGPFANLYNRFSSEELGNERAYEVMSFTRKVWLIIPIFFSIGLIIWLISVSTKRDPQQYYLR